MTDDKDKPSVLETKDEIKKRDDKAGVTGETAKDHDVAVSDMVEKVETPGNTGL